MSRTATWASADRSIFMAQSERILFFDGVCNLCNSLVKFIIKHDRYKRIKFATLQTDIVRKILDQHDSKQADSVVYLSGNRIFIRSAAILELFKDMGGGWKILYGFIVVPRFLRDYIYNVIARNRYRIFGKKEECMVPSPDIKERFLD